jgi:GAF domain-containing protein/ActR/RegA family two-component response regulator
LTVAASGAVHSEEIVDSEVVPRASDPASELATLRAEIAVQAARVATLERDLDDATRRAAEAWSVLEVSRAIPASLDLQLVLDLIVGRACQLLGTEKSGLAVLEPDPAGDSIRFVARRGLSAQFRERMRPRHWRDGTTPAAIVERRPVWSADILADPNLALTPETRRAIQAEGYRAVLSVPLLAGERVLGALVVYRDTAGPFADREVELLQAFAAQAAVAVANAWAYQASEQRRREAEVLTGLARDISAAHELPTLFQRVTDGARELCRSDGARLALPDRPPGALPPGGAASDQPLRMIVRHWAGAARQSAADVIVAGGPEGEVDGLVARGDPSVGARVLISGAPQRAVTPSGGPEALALDGEERASMAVPIRIEGAIEGLLLVGNRAARSFSDDDEAILAKLADHAAIAIQNARLLASSEAGRRTAESLADVGRLLAQSLDLREVGQRIAESTRELLGAVAATLYRIEESSGDLRAVAVSGSLGSSLGAGGDDGDRAEAGDTVVLARGTAVSGRAVTERQPVASIDVLTDPRIALTPELRSRLGQIPFRAALAVPLVARDRVIGALAVADRAGRVFTDEETRLVQAFADRAALALDNARLYEEARRRLAETMRRRAEAEELAGIARTLTETLDTTQVGERIVESVRPLLRARSAGLRLLEPDGSLRAIVWGDPARAHAGPGHVMPAGLGISGRVIADGQPVASPDVVTDPRIALSDDMREWMVGSGDRALLAVPLRVKGTVIGVLSVADETGRVYEDAEVALLQTCADQAAIALENARLYGELQQALLQVEDSQQRVIQGERLRALGELAGGVAHDFNNILAVILGRAQLLLRQVEEPRIRRQIEVVEQMALDGARTVRRIQEFARMRRARPFQVVDLSAIAAEVVEVTRARWRDQPQAGGATYEVRLETTRVPAVAGDPAELREALTNVVFNALDAMPQGGRLIIRTSASADGVICTIQDTGVGMPEAIRQRVFDPFFTTKGERGMGLGLSLVYGIIRRHGGQIDVTSEIGQGSRFTLTFPVSSAAWPDAPQQSASLPPSRRARILVIDDEAAVREFLHELLTSEGHLVVACDHGQAGLDAFEREPFEMVFTDLGMPEVSGWDVARRVKATRPGTAVALVTGWGDQIDPAEARAQGVDYLVPKPCSIGDVTAVVAEALGRAETGRSA